MDTSTRYMLADPMLTRRSPGEEFALAVVGAEGDVGVRLGVSLPTTFPLAQHRPRYTVRHLLKTATVVGEPVRFVDESRPPGGRETAGTSYASSPEATFAPSLNEAELTTVSVGVPLPAGLVRDPALLAAFVDHRVVVRLCTVENEVLLHGSPDKAIVGLLHLAGSRRRPAPGDLDGELLRAAAEVEEMGGSCDAIVAHPNRYWEMVGSGLLARLGDVGVRVSRTRMIAPNQVLLGDFGAAVTLLETGVSHLSLSGAVATASLDLGLAVHLPQHFMLLDLP